MTGDKNTGASDNNAGVFAYSFPLSILLSSRLD